MIETKAKKMRPPGNCRDFCVGIWREPARAAGSHARPSANVGAKAGGPTARSMSGRGDIMSHDELARPLIARADVEDDHG